MTGILLAGVSSWDEAVEGLDFLPFSSDTKAIRWVRAKVI
jgi:hypothetical protein